jgi:hypothetical protein
MSLRVPQSGGRLTPESKKEWVDHNSEEFHRELLEIEEELMAIMDAKSQSLDS